MTAYNENLWQTVLFLFLSKFVQQAQTPFPQQELINEKNIDLANRFVKMVGDTTEEKKIKLALLKALRGLEKEGLVLRLSETTLQLSNSGFARMKTEVAAAMEKISQSFPESIPKDNSSPTMQ